VIEHLAAEEKSGPESGAEEHAVAEEVGEPEQPFDEQEFMNYVIKLVI
jgi:hypothetical protein